jgi:DNA-directed RNA polymerase subunit E'/Rpb7
VDREINGVEELKVGETVRGSVKNIPEHGLFVSIGRSIDARVQIKELFDEVGASVYILFDPRLTSYQCHPVREGLAASLSSQPAR